MSGKDKFKNSKIKITFGIIVLNGEPFIKYNLRSLYPFAHEIIVVEGATRLAKNISTKDGHSTDNTLKILEKFKESEDPKNKIKIITREGYWEEKDEQSRAYAKVATGNYLWQVDIDEFYKEKDIKKIMNILSESDIDTVSFRQITFFGGLDYKVDGWYLQSGAHNYHRLFKWWKDYKYSAHRPPTILDESCKDLREKKWLKADEMVEKNIFLYHYSLLFPKQVEEKAKYYANGPWGEYSKGIVDWCKNNYLSKIIKPFQVHNVHLFVSWIEKYGGSHPDQVYKMISAIESGEEKTNIRDNSDIKKLLVNNVYKTIKALLKKLSIFSEQKFFPKKILSKFISRIKINY